MPPATLLESLDLLATAAIGVVIANAQTGGAETTQVIDEADGRGIPVIEFSETLPEGQTYLSWMQANIEALLARGRCADGDVPTPSVLQIRGRRAAARRP